MYLPEHFKEVDPAEIAQIISSAPLGCIIAHTVEGLVANHVPLFIDKIGDVIGHFALANEMHRLVPAGTEVLIVFRGVDGYVSPNYYPSKKEHHGAVPTWNYQAVHLYGTITFQHDVSSKRAAVGILTRAHERAVNGDGAWHMADAPADYMTEMLDKIVAFRVAVTRTIAKSKLSQNRDQPDRDGAIHGMRNAGYEALAEKMARKD
ncbi:transcriptional regulator [Devosia soli]|uniref:Transcriptional regulator n=1 Tax=Devosia soli TaxID=361041 RepID=A0A0F5L0V1_9HYPH|nr:FMN-binding negative transcriptional regulator [Devosia soli]KKB75830.1 transcriptional regulator [Devosia soli]